jgi:hypothetical protein
MQATPASERPGSSVSEQVHPALTVALWLAIAAQFGLIVISLILTELSLTPETPLVEGLAERILFGVVTLAYTTVGAICLLRRPSQPVGWLLSTVGLGWALANAATAYTQYAHGVSPAAVPGIEWARWLSGNSWTIVLSQGLLLLILLLFPTGSLLSPSWRPAARLVVGWTAVTAFATAFASGPIEDELGPMITNPAAAPGQAGAMLAALAGWLLYAFVILFAVTAIAVLLRFRRSQGAERQQMKWIAVVSPIIVVLVAGAYGVVVVAGGVPLSGDPRDVRGPLLPILVAAILSFAVFPVSIGIAILRYRLYDIDALINRTIVYGALTATLAAAYVGAIALFQVGLRPFTEQSQLAVAASTLVIAALFQPLRAGIQRAVDRRFYRRKYDAQRTVEAFRSRLRDEVDLAHLTDELGAVVKDSLQPASVTVWLLSDGRSS